ncbi:PREDICTED: PRAME family member 12-like [Chinchilla lanigera]|uniref:PRAME family member 12-like n=1 Tax=Chinchilla lanigera TaxID=34839 RepID=UPI00069693CD|nr:PREDICTED: PRAME family member 12-like [Chinchilla lanigera]
MEIYKMLFDTLLDILKMLVLNCVQEVELNCFQELHVDCAYFLKGCTHEVLRFTRMNTQSPPLLQKLAVRSLLRDKTLAMEALEYLPGALFPVVFMEAFTKGHGEVLKAMVLSWPFPCLPLGALMSMMKTEILDAQVDVGQMQKRMLQAVLDGLDVLLSQKVRSRRLRLQVLDMRVKHQNFWRVWGGKELEICSKDATKRRKTEETGSRGAKKQPLKVILQQWLYQGYMSPVDSSVLKWVQERDLVQLDCDRLGVTAKCFKTVMEVLEMLNIDSVQEVCVSQCSTLFTLAEFAPFLGQMRNLHKLVLSDVSLPAILSPEKEEQLFTQITSQFINLHCLQEIYMETVHFLEGQLDRVLRCLLSPLETLSLTHCQLSHSDWIQLPQAEQTRQLKVLQIRCIRLTDFSPEPLQILLKNVAATLTTLHLENCGITDEQVCDFLPSLSYCSQLTTFCFMRNFMSIDTMKMLLGHTAKLSNLTLEMYSVPPEVYVPWNGALQQILKQVHEALSRIMKPLNHPRRVWFCIVHLQLCFTWKFHNMHPTPCWGCIPV